MTDLTKITTPYGLLPEETQQALWEYEGEFELFAFNGWMRSKYPEFRVTCTYRAKSVLLTKPNIPWDFIAKKWTWCAKDKSETLWLYQSKPVLGEDYWYLDLHKSGSMYNITDLFLYGNCNWKDSLIMRGDPK